MWESPLLSLAEPSTLAVMGGPQGCQAVGGQHLLPPLFISSPIPSALPLRLFWYIK